MSGEIEDEDDYNAEKMQRECDEEHRAWEMEQRLERIATAVLAGMCAYGRGEHGGFAGRACDSVAQARALIAELDKEPA